MPKTLKERVQYLKDGIEEKSLPAVSNDRQDVTETLLFLRDNGDTKLVFRDDNEVEKEVVPADKAIEHQALMFEMNEAMTVFFKRVVETSRIYLKFGSNRFLAEEIMKIVGGMEEEVKGYVERGVREFSECSNQYVNVYRLFRMTVEYLRGLARTALDKYALHL